MEVAIILLLVVLVQLPHAVVIWQKKLMKKLTRVQKDGTVDFDFGRSTQIAENLFGPEAFGGPGDENMESEEDESWQSIPPLKIVMLIVGTRGDVQPFLAIGKRMQVLFLDRLLIILLISRSFAALFCDSDTVGLI